MAKNTAISQEPHTEKSLAKLKALLEYLVNPNRENESAYYISCNELANEKQDFSPNRALEEANFKNALLRKDTAAWNDLFAQTPKSSELFFPLFKKAQVKHNIPICYCGAS